jgi:hypothetical protein
MLRGVMLRGVMLRGPMLRGVMLRGVMLRGVFLQGLFCGAPASDGRLQELVHIGELLAGDRVSDTAVVPHGQCRV